MRKALRLSAITFQSSSPPARSGFRHKCKLRTPSHSTHPGPPRSSAVRLARRGEAGSVSSSEYTLQPLLCGAVLLVGSCGSAAPDRLESQAWSANSKAAVEVPPYSTRTARSKPLSILTSARVRRLKWVAVKASQFGRNSASRAVSPGQASFSQGSHVCAGTNFR
jgi:hypothetical protein